MARGGAHTQRVGVETTNKATGSRKNKWEFLTQLCFAAYHVAQQLIYHLVMGPHRYSSNDLK